MKKAKETIFDYEPTVGELMDLFSYNPAEYLICHGLTCLPFPTSEYREKVNARIAFFDIGLLFQYRGDLSKATRYFSKCPEIYAEYKKVRDGVV